MIFGKASAWSSTFNLNTLNGSTGFTIEGGANSDQLAKGITFGDFNGDGVDDIVVSTSSADPNGSKSGETYVIFGRNTSVVGNFSSTINVGSGLQWHQWRCIRGH